LGRLSKQSTNFWRLSHNTNNDAIINEITGSVQADSRRANMRRHQKLGCPAKYPLYTAHISSASCSSPCRSSECVRWKEDAPTAVMGTTAALCSRVGDRGSFTSNRFPSQSPGASSNLRRNSRAKRATPTLFIPLEELMQTKQLILVEKVLKPGAICGIASSISCGTLLDGRYLLIVLAWNFPQTRNMMGPAK
jgi:hypothetical protein